MAALPALIGGASVLKGIGSIFSGIGASKNASAIRKATAAASGRVSAFTNEFTAESKDQKANKLNILGNSEDVFRRIGGFIFGDTETEDNLRKAQGQFSALAAGDTSGFTREIESIVKSAFANTSGSPKGAFENLSARNLFDFRSQGLNNALSLTNQIAGLGQGLINTEFGINDQDFNNRMRLRENEVNQLNALSLQSAQTRGAGAAAIGNAFNTFGQGMAAYGQAQYNQQVFDTYGLPQLINQQKQALGASGSNAAVPILPSVASGGTYTPLNVTNPSIGLPYGGNPFSPQYASGVGANGGPGVLPALGGSLIDLVGGFGVAPIRVGQGNPNQEYTSIE